MTSGPLNLLEIVGSAGLVVQGVLMILILFSVASWTIIFTKFLSLRNALRNSLEFVEAFWGCKSLSDAFGRAREMQDCPATRLFRSGYKEIRKMAPGTQAETLAGVGGVSTLSRALKRSITEETTRMGQMVPFLATCGNTAPFIGLFGTVWGIMDAFHGIGQTGSASLSVVAPGISEALVATAVGLGVAIPSVIGYNFFLQRIRRVTSELDSFAADFLNIVERDLSRGNGGK